MYRIRLGRLIFDYCVDNADTRRRQVGAFGGFHQRRKRGRRWRHLVGGEQARTIRGVVVETLTRYRARRTPNVSRSSTGPHDAQRVAKVRRFDQRRLALNQLRRRGRRLNRSDSQSNARPSDERVVGDRLDWVACQLVSPFGLDHCIVWSGRLEKLWGPQLANHLRRASHRHLRRCVVVLVSGLHWVAASELHWWHRLDMLLMLTLVASSRQDRISMLVDMLQVCVSGLGLLLLLLLAPLVQIRRIRMQFSGSEFLLVAAGSATCVDVMKI